MKTILVLVLLLFGTPVFAGNMEEMLCGITGGTWKEGLCIYPDMSTVELTATKPFNITKLKKWPKQLQINYPLQNSNVYVGIYDKQTKILWIYHGYCLFLDKISFNGSGFDKCATKYRKGSFLFPYDYLDSEQKLYDISGVKEELLNSFKFLKTSLIQNYIFFFGFGIWEENVYIAGLEISENP